MTDEQIAKVCHEANRSYCQAIGDDSQLPWDEAPEWQKESAINGAKFHRENPDASPDHSHNEWLREKVEAGWRWGPKKIPYRKEHPCILPFEKLPPEQQMQDVLFAMIVQALAG